MSDGNHRPKTAASLGLWLVLIAVVVAGCSDGQDSEDHRVPLQPLVYTEDPDLTPEGAAVRERRLQRQLLEGADQGQWGRLEAVDDTRLPRLDDPTALGRALAEALLEGDDELWEHLFVSPRGYARLTGADADRASDFVDNIKGESTEIRAMIDGAGEPGSSGDPGDHLEVRGLEPGPALDVDGNPVEDDDRAVQFSDNRLLVEAPDAGVVFELRIPRIFRERYREAEAEDAADDRSRLSVGSAVEAGDRLRTYLEAGLHLEPELLRSEEYPFPLGVGTFWRYERVAGDRDDEGDDTVDPRLEDDDVVGAEELIVEVREISKYGSYQLVEFLHSYRDRHHTRIPRWWVVTPRRIYRCNQECRDNIEDIDWLLDYFGQRPPLLEFPLRPGAEIEAGAGQPAAVVDDQWHDIETDAGTFTGSFELRRDDLRLVDHRYLADVDIVRYFAPGRGFVRHEIDPGEEAEDRGPVVERLVEYRLMD